MKLNLVITPFFVDMIVSISSVSELSVLFGNLNLLLPTAILGRHRGIYSTSMNRFIVPNELGTHLGPSLSVPSHPGSQHH